MLNRLMQEKIPYTLQIWQQSTHLMEFNAKLLLGIGGFQHLPEM